MRLDQCSWQEVDAYLKERSALLVPVGSTEQHGPMGLIGTDAFCAETIAQGAAEATGILLAPTLALTPAPFNLAFPGTISISVDTFLALLEDLLNSVIGQGFRQIYFLNAHGANLAPLYSVAANRPNLDIHIASWWDFPAVNQLRKAYYGDWEGMHATPSEIAITQVSHRQLPPGEASAPPRKLTAEFIAAHAGDRHGPPDQHRADFPDGRVGSHSALAKPEHGQKLLQAAIESVAADLREWLDA